MVGEILPNLVTLGHLIGPRDGGKKLILGVGKLDHRDLSIHIERHTHVLVLEFIR